MLTSRKALIARIEIWTPYFWIEVYEIIGKYLPFPLILNLVFYIFWLRSSIGRLALIYAIF